MIPRLDGDCLAEREVALIEKAALHVGMKSLMNHGAASCVYSEGCNGVTQSHLIAFAREIALHCVAALSASKQGGEADGLDARRLVWAMDNMGLRDTGTEFVAHVLRRGGTGDYSDCVTFIDERMPPAPAAKPQGANND
jgi:hypothetical protein